MVKGSNFMIMSKISKNYIKLSLIVSLFSISHASIEVVMVDPKGEYASIDVKKSFDAYLILRGRADGDKANTAMEVDKNPGNHTPYTLMALGLYYISVKEFDKAATYIRGSVFRAIVDVKASNDPSLGDVVPTMCDSIHNAISQTLDKDEIKKLTDALVRATKELISWDKKTPRNYDVRWASLHSSGAFTGQALNYASPKEYQKIIEEEYKQFKEGARLDGINVD